MLFSSNHLWLSLSFFHRCLQFVLVLNKRLLFFPVVLEATDSSLSTVAMMPKFVYLLVQKATNLEVWGAVCCLEARPALHSSRRCFVGRRSEKNYTLIMRTNVALRKTMMANKKIFFFGKPHQFLRRHFNFWFRLFSCRHVAVV